MKAERGCKRETTRKYYDQLREKIRETKGDLSSDKREFNLAEFVSHHCPLESPDEWYTKEEWRVLDLERVYFLEAPQLKTMEELSIYISKHVNDYWLLRDPEFFPSHIGPDDEEGDYVKPEDNERLNHEHARRKRLHQIRRNEILEASRRIPPPGKEPFDADKFKELYRGHKRNLFEIEWEYYFYNREIMTLSKLAEYYYVLDSYD